MVLAGWANNCGIELFTIGRVQCPGEIISSPPSPSGRGSGPTHGIRKEGYKDHREAALRETRHNRILREDEDVIALIVAILTKGLL